MLLILSGVAYVLSFPVAVTFPEWLDTLNTFAFPLYFGELIVILWLAFVGAKPRALRASLRLRQGAERHPKVVLGDASHIFVWSEDLACATFCYARERKDIDPTPGRNNGEGHTGTRERVHRR